jgi:hypothetical protein
VLWLSAAVFLLAGCEDEPWEFEAAASPERVNWGSAITPTGLIELEGTVVADLVEFDAQSRFQVTGYKSNAGVLAGWHFYITLDQVDDDGTIPTVVSSASAGDGFPGGTRVRASSKLSSLTNDVTTGTVVMVGGDYDGATNGLEDPVITIKVGTASAVTPTITGTLEAGEVLHAVARHGRDGFMAVGDDGLIVRTRPDEEGRHDLTTWYVERPPWMAPMCRSSKTPMSRLSTTPICAT